MENAKPARATPRGDRWKWAGPFAKLRVEFHPAEVDAMTDSMDRVAIEPQSVVTPLSRAAVFLVLKLDPEARALTRAVEVISDIGGIIRAVGFRDLHGR